MMSKGHRGVEPNMTYHTGISTSPRPNTMGTSVNSGVKDGMKIYDLYESGKKRRTERKKAKAAKASTKPAAVKQRAKTNAESRGFKPAKRGGSMNTRGRMARLRGGALT